MEQSVPAVPRSNTETTPPLGLSPEDSEELERRLRSLEALPRTDAESEYTILWDNCTREFYDEIGDYVERTGRKTRVEYIGGRAVISELGPPSFQHEAAAQFFSGMASTYNTQNGSPMDTLPLKPNGAAGYNLDDGRRSQVSPDNQLRMRGRSCPNVIVEVAHTQTLLDLCDKAKSYIKLSANIMIVCGIKIFPNRALLFLLYERPGAYFGMLMPNHVPLIPSIAISFGPAAMTTAQVNEFSMYTGMPIHRLRGFYDGQEVYNNHDPPCRDLGQAPYMVCLPRNLLLSEDNFGHVNEAYSAFGDMEIDLYKLQLTMDEDA